MRVKERERRGFGVKERERIAASMEEAVSKSARPHDAHQTQAAVSPVES